MTSTRRAIVLLLAAGLVSAPLVAQADSQTPEQVAAQLLAAMHDTDWVRAASLMHPSALAQFHDMFRPILQCDNPGVVEARNQIFGFTSAVQAARVSDTALIAALLRHTMSREQGVADALRSAQLHIIGHVAEGPDTVHVLARLSMMVDSIPISNVEVISFGRYGSTWRTLLKADISALAGMLRRLCLREG